MYEIKVSKNVEKFLLKCDDFVFEKFESSMQILKTNPKDDRLDIKKLAGMQNHYRLRISKYRFLYEAQNDVLLVYFYKADSRGDVYKK